MNWNQSAPKWNKPDINDVVPRNFLRFLSILWSLPLLAHFIGARMFVFIHFLNSPLKCVYKHKCIYHNAQTNTRKTSISNGLIVGIERRPSPRFVSTYIIFYGQNRHKAVCGGEMRFIVTGETNTFRNQSLILCSIDLACISEGTMPADRAGDAIDGQTVWGSFVSQFGRARKKEREREKESEEEKGTEWKEIRIEWGEIWQQSTGYRRGYAFE